MGDDDSNNCSMVGLLGIIIQVGLGVLSFSVLVVKRFREHPRRPWKIWVFDTSKQLLSQLMAHFINLTISIALAYNDASADECLWYFITNVLDNTLGVLVCVLCLKGIEKSLRHRKKFEYISGNYYLTQKVKMEIEIMDFSKGEVKDNINVQDGHPIPVQNKGQLTEQKQEKQEGRQSRVSTGSSRPGGEWQQVVRYRINYKSWLVQLLIWMSIVVIGKSVVLGLQLGIQQPLKNFSFLILGWIEAYPIFELILVIVIVPVIMNGLAFWIQDNFLKKKEDTIPVGESRLIEEVTPRDVLL